jgi:hypothetical protein
MNAVERAAKIAERWAELGVQEGQNGPVLPTAIKSRDARGQVKEVAIVLQCSTNLQRVQARRRARTWAAELKIKPDRVGDQAHDADLVEELERVEKLAFCIRDPEPPFDQKYPTGAALYEAVPHERVLTGLYQELDNWELMNDPRVGDLDAEDLWQVLAEIRRAGDLRPLWRTGGLEQIASIMLAVEAAFCSTMTPSRWRSPSTSRSESAAPTTESTEPEPPQS